MRLMFFLNSVRLYDFFLFVLKSLDRGFFFKLHFLLHLLGMIMQLLFENLHSYDAV